MELKRLDLLGNNLTNTGTAAVLPSGGMSLKRLDLLASTDSAQPNVPDSKGKQGNLLEGIGYVGGKLVSGISGILEGIWDYSAGGIAKLFGADEYAKKLMDDDYTNRFNQLLDDWYNPGKAMKFIGDVTSGIGQSSVGMGAVALATIISGGTLAAPVAALVAGSTIGLGAAGQSTASAYQKTGELGGKEFLYGGLSGALEGALEGITSAVSGLAKSVSSATAKTVAKSAVRQGIVKTILTEGAGEFVEEALSEFLDPYLQRMTGVDKEAENATWGEIAYSGLVGFVSGAVMGGGTSVITNARNAKLGNAIIESGKADATVQEGNRYREYNVTEENKKILGDTVENLNKSLNSYEKLGDKTGTQGKLILGEISSYTAQIEMKHNMLQIRQNAVNYADELSAAYKEMGQDISADDIRSNKKGITDKLSINILAGKLFPEMQGELLKADPQTAFKALPDTIDIADGSAEVYKSDSGARVAVRRKGDGYTVAVANAKGKTLSNSAPLSYDAAMRVINEARGKSYEQIESEYAERRKVARKAIQKDSRAKIKKSAEQTVQKNSLPVVEQAIVDKAITRAEVSRISDFAKNKGIKVKYFYEKGAEDGRYEKGVINVNLASTEGAYYTAIHEYGHYLEENAPHLLSDYLKQVDYLVKNFDTYKKIADDVTELYRNDERTKNISDEDLRKEIAFKISKHLIDNTAEFNNIVTKNLTLGQRILLWFKNFYNRLKRTNFDAEARAVNDAVKALQKAVSEKVKADERTVKDRHGTERKYSLQKSFAEQVDDVVNGKHNPNLDLYVSETPKVLLDIGFENSPLLMRSSKINEILEKHSEMSVDLIKKIPKAIENPLLILKSKTNPKESVVMITDIKTTKGEMIVPVWIKQDGVYLDIEIDNAVKINTNFIATAYGRNVQGLLEYAVENDGILYQSEDNKKISDLFTQRGLQLPTRPNKSTDSNNSISTSSKNVNTKDKFSLSKSDENILSKGQYKKVIANNTQERVFAKTDAVTFIHDLIDNYFIFNDFNGGLKGKQRDALVNKLWILLNEGHHEDDFYNAHFLPSICSNFLH